MYIRTCTDSLCLLAFHRLRPDVGLEVEVRKHCQDDEGLTDDEISEQDGEIAVIVKDLEN